ncbi:MAG TPA: response regulator [Ktedonobacteraceae bacterium]|nr:response regulator [Ktedonobacteraceae bacterium]
MVEQSVPGKVIAIVEDDSTLAGWFRDALEYEGHWQLRFFSDGQLAMRELPELCADLILLDVGLPNLDGASLYKILRGHSNTRSTPIIVITGSRDWELHRMGLSAGLFLRKPFRRKELLVMIQALLGDEREGQPDDLSPGPIHDA